MRKNTPVAYLGLGSNLGDRAANLLKALPVLVSGELTLIKASSIYETEPLDYPDQPSFLNMVIALSGEEIEPFSLLRFCLEIELRLGRQRTIPRGARTIDIDLLLLDDLVIDGIRDGIELLLPHPRMHLRRFVLAPLVEIAPALLHPVLGKTMMQLLGEVDNLQAVRIYNP